MNACSSRCGWCGRCEDDIRTTPPPRDYLFCDYCGKDVIHPVTLAGVGIACSRTCMDKLEFQYAMAIQGRRH